MDRINTEALGWQSLLGGKGWDKKQAFQLVATWQQGTPQYPPTDYLSFARDGYSRNTLIHSCIRELATSAADAALRVCQVDGDERKELPNHALRRLIQEPNEEIDEFGFFELLITYLQVAGNCYIEKVRNDAGQVRKLGFLRPDRVKVVAGSGDERVSGYEYSVDGSEPTTLAREDVIHFRLPNLVNDFYGLSPVEVLAREGNVDSDMTDMLRAFFTNAGVPFGVLRLKSKTSQTEVSRIKRLWRSMFVGVKRWFDLLVIDVDSEYQQLSLSQKDMEFIAAREQVEARICGTFGVPPILIGAAVGLKHATYSNYETADRACWKNTKMPLFKRVASKLRRELLPEFEPKASARSNLAVAFDLSEVEALREDNSDKLKVATDLVRSGGWTVNQALQSVGLPAIDGGGIYLRPVTLVVESETQSKALAARATKAAKQGIAEQVRTTREKLVPAMTLATEQFFDEQAERVADRLSRQQAMPLAADLLPSGEDALILNAMLPHYLGSAEVAWDLASEYLSTLPKGLAVKQLDDEALKRLRERAMERMTGINNVTRDEMQRLLDEATQRGYGLHEIVNGVPDEDFPAMQQHVSETYHNRALAIARTEIGDAAQAASVLRYEATGVVKKVEVLDGDGPNSCDACIAVNGAIWDLDYAWDHCLEHPNCLVGDSQVLAPNLEAAFLRRFEGEVIVLRTAANDLLTCTPNHPVLTDRGWLAAGELQEGDYVLRCLDSQRVAQLLDPDDHHMPAAIEQIARSALESFPVSPRSMPCAPEDFHGDGSGSYVYVIGANSQSQGRGDSVLSEHGHHVPVELTDVGLGALFTQGTAGQFNIRALRPPHGGVGGSGLELATLAANRGKVNPQRIGLAAYGQPALLPHPAEGTTTQPMFGRDLIAGLSGLIAPVQIVEINRRGWSGHVYNLQTAQGWYLAENIITHNCVRSFAPVIEGIGG